MNKATKEKSEEGVIRDVGGKNILFIGDKAVGELRSKTLEDELTYNPSDLTGDVAKGILCVGYLLESLTDAGNAPLEAMTAYGLSLALQHYASDVRQYLKPKAEPILLQDGPVGGDPSVVLEPLIGGEELRRRMNARGGR